MHRFRVVLFNKPSNSHSSSGGMLVYSLVAKVTSSNLSSRKALKVSNKQILENELHNNFFK